MNQASFDNVLRQKLPEPELRSMAERDDEGTVSVIVEPDLRPQKIVPVKRSGGGGASPFLVKVAEETPARQRENSVKVERTREFLYSLTGGQPHWLNSARAFVVHAAPFQLKEMAHFPLIKTIRLNRQLKRTG